MWVYYGDTGRVEGDDATRTATTYDAAGAMTGTRPYTAEENATADAAVASAASLVDIEARLARIEAKLWPPVDPDAEVPATVPTMADYAGIWPAGQLLSDGGKIWRNVTTVPLTTPPERVPRRTVAVDAPVRGGFWWRRA